MGKRSNFARRKQDAYDTPPKAVLPLLPYLPDLTAFVEPCAGKGDLVAALQQHGHRCVLASDIEPRGASITQRDYSTYRQPMDFVDAFITNPPWTREILHPLIAHLSQQAPTWLLFDADWAHTKQARPFLPYCRRIVSAGRISWMQNGTSGKDNCAWYLFDQTSDYAWGAPLFHGWAA